MRMNKRIINIILIIMYSSLVLSGCKEKTVKDEFVKMDVAIGSVVRENKGVYSTYVLRDGDYFRADVDEAIYAYDKVSGHYIYEKDNKRIVRTSDNRIEIKDTNIKNLELSPGGKYTSYFINEDNHNKLIVLDLDSNKNIVMDSDVTISGNLVNWFDEDTLVYYGISKDRKNGLFTYNITTGEEKLLYEIKEGYLLFFEKIESGIIFLCSNRNNKNLYLLKNDKTVTKIQENIENLYDVEETSKGIFVMASTTGGIYSIYSIQDNKLKRLIYDYPTILHYEKGLSSDAEGNILFIGGVDGFDEELIYKYKDGDVCNFNDDIGKYYFVKMN